MMVGVKRLVELYWLGSSVGVVVVVREDAGAGVAVSERVHLARALLLRHRPQQTPVRLSPATTLILVVNMRLFY